MTFSSILFDDATVTHDAGAPEEPACFGDLDPDQIVASVGAGREEYDVGPFFCRSRRSVEAVHYRDHVSEDLSEAAVLESVRTSRGERI